MKKFELLAASALAVSFAQPALAQSGTTAATAQAADTGGGIEDIVVTAQRQSETLQTVPIAVSAFSAETLDKQQIENASDLQLTLPNVVFTKGNFTGSSFTIRGIGDLCVGVACDSATAIHLNGTPLLGTRLFETEYFDLERIEVLRGPQGTLFGRNATSGVVNFLSAKPDLSGFHVTGEGEYGNFDAYKVKGMINVPLGDTLAFRGAGFYQKRDGYTKNLFNNTRIDGRDMYAVRGSLRWEPDVNTTVDLMAYYFREKDDRLRIQKQLCQRDPTGVLGCLPGRLDYGITNANSQFSSTLISREFLTIQGIPAAFGLGSLYGPDAYANNVNPADPRVVNTDNVPKYFTDEQQYQARVEHDFGTIKAQLTGFYHEARVDAGQDYNLSVADRSVYAPGLATLAAAAAGQVPGLPAAYFTPIASALIPNGPAGQLCTSLPEETGTGAYGGFKSCAATPQDYDRSNQKNTDWSAEGIISSHFDGAFNFLLGGIYADAKVSENSYYVNGFSIDYLSGVLGSFNSLGRAALGFRPSYLGTPFFRNQTDNLRVKSYGIFGESYFEFDEKLKLTLGLRYNNDKKSVRARSTLASFLVPYGSTDAFSSPYVLGFNSSASAAAFSAPFDADPATACTTTPTANGVVTASTGCDLYQVRKVGFDAWTGRAVLDYKIDDNHLLYASYSRGYKSGGINPPLQPIFAVPDSFSSEKVDSFEVGSKNTFLNGTLRLNLTGFYYKYKNLQLSRIVARTAVNDNVNADIYGVELEGIIAPTRDLNINLGFSYLHTKVAEDKFISNPRDFSGGRSDAVIIKDLTNASNCAVIPTTAGNAAGVNAYVGAVNGGLGLRAPTAFPSDSGLNGATGAFSICSVLASTAAAPSAALRAAFATPTGALPFTVLTAGVPVNINGNRLPQAPTVKASAGVQYTVNFSGGMSLVPRADITYTGESYGNIFNGNVNRIRGYEQVNAQLQLNGADDRWYVRGFVQNLTKNSAITGLAVGDQSSGLFTNVFTLEPRRYGIGAGFKF